MSFPNVIYGPLNARLQTAATQQNPLGTKMILPDGRVFRYAKAGGVALNIGTLAQEAVVTTGHTKDLAVAAAAAIGATAVTITNSTTAITANMYAEGYLFTNDAAGEGQICTIKSHCAEATGSGSCVITLEDEDALTVALTTLSEVGLRKNLYKDLVVCPTTLTGIVAGVVPCAVALNYYFWVQTWGPAAILTNGTVIRGLTCVASGTTGGAVDVTPLNSVGTSGQEFPVGTVMSVAGSTEYSLVNLTIAP
jgi:hypothetical protein